MKQGICVDIMLFILVFFILICKKKFFSIL